MATYDLCRSPGTSSANDHDSSNRFLQKLQGSCDRRPGWQTKPDTITAAENPHNHQSCWPRAEETTSLAEGDVSDAFQHQRRQRMNDTNTQIPGSGCHQLEYLRWQRQCSIHHFCTDQNFLRRQPDHPATTGADTIETLGKRQSHPTPTSKAARKMMTPITITLASNERHHGLWQEMMTTLSPSKSAKPTTQRFLNDVLTILITETR